MKKATARKNAIRSSIAIASRAVYWLSATTTTAISPITRKPRSIGRSERNFGIGLGGHVGPHGKHGCQQGSSGEPPQPTPRIRRGVEPRPGRGKHREASVHVMHALVRAVVVGQEQQPDCRLR